MVMTIDDCMLALTKERKTALHENKQAFDMAISIMRKYQQIQEIVNHWNNTGGSTEESDILDYIEEVLKDGKV